LGEVPDVTEVPEDTDDEITDDMATAEDPATVEGGTPGPTPDPPGWTTFTTVDGLASNDVIAVDAHADATTWAMTATPQGSPHRISLGRFDDGTWTTFDVRAGRCRPYRS